MLGRHRGGRRGGRRHPRPHRPQQIVHYPYYGYGYPYPYSGYPYYDYFREPPFVIQEASSAPPSSRLSLHIPTIAASLLLSYLIWGRK